MGTSEDAGELVRAQRTAARDAAEAGGAAAVLVGSTGFALGAAALAMPQAAWAHALAALSTVVCAAAAVMWWSRHRRLSVAARTLASSADLDVESGLPGPAALERELTKALTGAQRLGTPVSIVTVLVDDLRGLHLERGLGAGRRLLFQAGVALTSLTSPRRGRVFRGPGATLVALLPDASLAEAERISQKTGPSLELLARRNGGLVRLASGAAAGLPGDLAEDLLLRAERRGARQQAGALEGAVRRAVPPSTPG
jgi:GGDEF domain-containing protein